MTTAPAPLRALGAVLVLSTLIAFGADPAPESAARRHAELRAEIARHDALYFRAARPEITDAEYDALRRELRELEQLHPDLAATPVAPGDDRTGRFPTHAHLTPMLGLDKSHTEAELRKFLARVRRAAGADLVTWVIEPKFDGLAVSLVYEDGTLRRAVTRGNGAEGDVVTDNLLECAPVPRQLARDHGPVPRWVEIRGEVYLAQAEFDRLNAERRAAGAEIFAHPRNLAVGTLKSLDAAERAGRRLSFVAFGWGAWEPAADAPASQQDLLRRLGAWGFETPELHVASGEETVWGIARAMERGRIDFPAPLDGVVVKVDDVALRARLGDSRTAPAWAIAHKFEPARAETRLRAIVLQVGRTGTITPVAELDPVVIGGATIARATLHNRREIERRDYRVGDIVRVERAGEVIPQLVGVNLARRPADSVPFAFPSGCPACGTALEPDGEANLRCPQRACPAQMRRRVEHFVSAAALDLRGFGPALAAALVDRGLVRDLDDLYRLPPGELPPKVQEQLERSKQAEGWRFIAGLGLPEIGGANARKLAQHCRSLEALAAADEAALRAAGLTESAARAAAAELRRPETQRVLAAWRAAGVAPRWPDERGALTGKFFVFTGTFQRIERAEAERRVRAAGGRVQSTVSRHTSYVVAGEGGGRKREEAQRLGVPVLDEEAFLALLPPAGPD